MCLCTSLNSRMAYCGLAGRSAKPIGFARWAAFGRQAPIWRRAFRVTMREFTIQAQGLYTCLGACQSSADHQVRWACILSAVRSRRECTIAPSHTRPGTKGDRRIANEERMERSERCHASIESIAIEYRSIGDVNLRFSLFFRILRDAEPAPSRKVDAFSKFNLAAVRSRSAHIGSLTKEKREVASSSGCLHRTPFSDFSLLLRLSFLLKSSNTLH